MSAFLLALCGFCLEVSSSSGCLGWTALFHCGTSLAFHIIIGVSPVNYLDPERQSRLQWSFRQKATVEKI